MKSLLKNQESFNRADFYATVYRSHLRCVHQVGEAAFFLYIYFLTWSTADVIRPSLARIEADLGLSKSAICNRRATLKRAGWIAMASDGEIILQKPFTKDESLSRDMNESFTKDERPFTKNESPYKEENKQREGTKRNSDSPELIAFRRELTEFQNAFAKPTTKGMAIANNNAIRDLFDLSTGRVDRCVKVHQFQQDEPWRKSKVNWTTVLKDFTATERELSKTTRNAPPAQNGSFDHREYQQWLKTSKRGNQNG